MLKNEIQILIVDDDRSFGKACFEAVRRAGFQCVLAQNPAEALQSAKIQQFQVIVVDCMLPKIPGVELVGQIKALQHTDVPTIMMSGIYRDKGFVHKAKRSTGAVEFLAKPVTGDELVKVIEKILGDSIEEAKDPLPGLLADQSAKKKQILDAIEKSENVHGFELPFIYALFINAGLTGQMNVIEAEGELFGISFHDGKIVSVETSDPPTKLGGLLVDRGYLTPDELTEALATKREGIRLGEQLTEENLVSPHAIDEILVEQMEARLANTFFDTSIEVNFVESDDIKDSYGINMVRFVPLLEKWLNGKISEKWLEKYYLSWLDNNINQGLQWDKYHPAARSEFIRRFPDFFKDVLSAKTIQNLLGNKKYTPSEIYRGVHLLAITRCIAFGPRTQETNYDLLHERLKKMESENKDKNYFEILNLSKNARAAEIRRSYHELAKLLHPDKLPGDAPAEIKELNDRVFAVINEAHNALKDEKTRFSYLKELEDGKAKELLRVEGLVERGKHLLKTGNLKQALDVFDEGYRIQQDNFELNGHRIWTRLKMIDPDTQSQELHSLEQEITALAQYDRRSELFHFIKGLYQFKKGNLELAKNHIENAVAVNPNFLEARRELNLIKLKQKNNKPVDILRGDLKDVVGMLFKRK